MEINLTSPSYCQSLRRELHYPAGLYRQLSACLLEAPAIFSKHSHSFFTVTIANAANPMT